MDRQKQGFEQASKQTNKQTNKQKKKQINKRPHKAGTYVSSVTLKCLLWIAILRSETCKWQWHMCVSKHARPNGASLCCTHSADTQTRRHSADTQTRRHSDAATQTRRYSAERPWRAHIPRLPAAVPSWPGSPEPRLPCACARAQLQLPSGSCGFQISAQEKAKQ